jgi:hypothetical protein
MKKIRFLIASASVGVLLFSCTSPDEKAKELATQYNDILKGYSECTTQTGFVQTKSKANSAIQLEYEECEEKYSSDAEKSKLFHDVFQKETQAMNDAYQEAYAKFIENALTNGEWYKPCIKSGWYIYSFKEGKFNIVGSKNAIDYSLSTDTIFFNDDEKNVVVVDFGYDTNSFTMKDVKTNESVSFKRPTDRGKMCGSWYQSEYWSINFKNNGKYVSKSLLFGTSTHNWKFSDGTFTWPNGEKGKVTFTDIDHVKVGSDKFSRTYKKGPSSVSFLFDKDNQVDDPVEKQSSSSGSGDWDSVLDDFEDFVDSYVKLYKKAMDGDMSAISEYPGVLSKAESLSNKLSNAESDLTSAQLSRYTKILNKMTSVY